MRNVVLGGLLTALAVTSASAADLGYGYGYGSAPPPPPPVYAPPPPVYRPPPPPYVGPPLRREEDLGYDRGGWRDSAFDRPPPPRVRIEEQDEEPTEPECFTRRTPYGPEQVCR